MRYLLQRRTWLLALMLGMNCGRASADTIPTYDEQGPSRLWQGVAVQHFTVPYGSVGRKVEFFGDLGGTQVPFPDHEVAVQVYSFDGEHLATHTQPRKEFPGGRGWIGIEGLSLEPGVYYVQMFTNSQALAEHLQARLFSNSPYRAGHAASGWKGGEPLGRDEDFQTRLTMERLPPPAVELGSDPGYLVKDGQANYPIVLARDSIPAEWTAAEELRDHLKAMTGVEWPILLEDDYEAGPMIAVGFNRKLPLELQAEHFGPLEEQELIIQPTSPILLLAGGQPQGTLYAVYEYLHQLGVRWYTPEYTHVPPRKELPFPQAGYRYRPPVESRSMVVGNHSTAAWLARNRLTSNSLWSGVGLQYGSPYGEGPDMHTFWRLVPTEVLAQNPAWRAEVKGRREPAVGQAWQLCLNNPEVRKYVIDRTLEWARNNPRQKTVWIGQNDGPLNCTCENCQAFYQAHGGQPSSLIVQLVNELADAVAREMPDRRVKTLAYGWGATPPEEMTLRDNVIVMVCDYNRVAEWRKIAPHVAVYIYGAHGDYWSPAPTLYAKAEELQKSYRDGAAQLYYQISGWMNWYGSEAMHLRAWVSARLMWNPELETQDLLEDFVQGYYGPAAPAVRQAIEWVHQNAYNAEGQLRTFNDSKVVPNYIHPATMRRINQLFERTCASLENEDYQKRLSFAWLPYLWTDFWLGYTEPGQYDAATQTWSVPMADGEIRNRYGALAKKFFAEHGVNTLRELVQLHPNTLGVDKMGVPFPAYPLEAGPVQTVVVPEVGGLIADFRDRELDFAPLKPYWGFKILEYPLFSATEDNVNGVQVTAYAVGEAQSNRLTLMAQREDCEIQKIVSMADGSLVTELSIKARKQTEISAHTDVMFNLFEEVFGVHPGLYLEQTDGSWTKRVMGTETDFWWIEGDLDLSQATGRIVLARQNGPEGVLLTCDPAQLKNLYFWYDNYRNYPDDQWGMLRLFLHAKPGTVEKGEGVSLHYSLKILPQASAVLEQAEDGKE